MIPPVSPCGHTVDYVRSCYSRDVIFFKDSEELTTIQWYFTDKPPLPVPTGFCSRNWAADNGQWDSIQGEQSGQIGKWVNGKRPVEAGVMGPLHYCGTPEQWYGDLSIADALTDADLNLLGAPLCCNPAPPMGALLGLQAEFQAVSMLVADLPAHARVTAALDSGGLLPSVLASVDGLLAPGTGAGVLGASLQAVGTVVAATRGQTSSLPLLPASAGLTATTHATGATAPLLSATGTLQGALAAGRSLPTILAALSALLDAPGALALLSADLSALSAPETQTEAAGDLLASLAAIGAITCTPHGTAFMPAALDLIATVKTLAAAKGILLSDLEAMNVILSALSGEAAPVTVGGSKLSLSITTAAFQVVTPGGGCGSLPASIVVRFGSGTGHFTTLNGKSATLTWSAGPSNWTGSVTTTDGTSSITLACVSTHWAFNLSGSAGGGTNQLTGTSGATPSLSGTITLTGPGTGSIVATVTRT